MAYRVVVLFFLVCVFMVSIVNLHLQSQENILLQVKLKESPISVKDFFVITKSFAPDLDIEGKHLILLESTRDLIHVINLLKETNPQYVNSFVIKLSNNEMINYDIEEILLNQTKEK